MPHRLFLAALLLGLSLPAMASSTQDIAEARRLLDEVQEEAAAALLTQAVGRPGATPAQRAEMHVLLAVALFNLRDTEGARAAFRAALDADPTVSVPKMLPPKGWALFEQVRVQRERELASAPPGGSGSSPLAAGAPSGALPRVEAAKPTATLGSSAQVEAGWSGRRIAGAAVGAVGAGAAIAGGLALRGAFELRARADSELDGLESEKLYRQGASSHSAGSWMLAAGAAAAAIGATLVWWPEGERSTTLAVGPAGITLAAAF